MAKIQCKMCGGELDLPQGVSSGECNYCGNMVTFPKISDEQSEILYNRAEQYRRMREYDKAVATYEKIVEINSDDAEAYWGLVLSRYGIEYVEDPVSHERIPTCNRVQYESILADADYLAALEHAGSYEKGLYEADAKRIAEIQRGILAISAQEEPFDVFICYKESDDMGRRTRDSVVAQEIYYELTEAGYKVFFARITLESKIGQQYEPYIFAALNSAKAMLVVGSKKEFFEAVWVKNEWSRYLALIKKDRKKLLIPCYRDMDAYDIPAELSMFQAQDMSKIGFIQDVLHGLQKVLGKNEEKASEVKTQTQTKNTNTQTAAPVSEQQTGKDNPLVRRAKIFVETHDFFSAEEYCDKALDQEPENGWAYFYKFLAEVEFADEKELVANGYKPSFASSAMNTLKSIVGSTNQATNQPVLVTRESLNGFINFTMAKKYADRELKQRIDDFYRAIDEKINHKKEAVQKQMAEERKKAEDVAKAQAEAVRKQQAETAIRNAINGRISLLSNYLSAYRALNANASVIRNLEAQINAERACLFKLDSQQIIAEKSKTDALVASLGNLKELQAQVTKNRTRKILIVLGSIFSVVLLLIITLITWVNSASFVYESAVDYEEDGNYRMAMNYYTEAAQKGHAEAQYKLGLCYEKGDYVEQNFTEAIKYYRMAANLKHSGAQAKLRNNFFKNYIAVTEKNSSEAKYRLGVCYWEGDGVAKDTAKAMDLINAAAEEGVKDAQYHLGKYNVEIGRYSDAVKWYSLAADQGHAEALFELGNCFYYGRGVNENIVEAIKYYRLAGDKEHAGALEMLDGEKIQLFVDAYEMNYADSQYNLGMCYYNGKMFAKNYKTAVEWFTKAADQDYSEAMYMLGMCYYRGEGVEFDLDEAVKWWHKAAEKDNENAQEMLKTKEISLYVLSTVSNDPKSQFDLSKFYSSKGNIEMYLMWMRKSAEQGYHEAQNELGCYYYNNKGKIKNYTEAVKFFRMAAEQDDMFAQYNLGLCYYYGNGVEKDVVEAVKLFNKSAQQNYDEAKKMLEDQELQLVLAVIESNDAQSQYNLAKYYNDNDDVANAVNWCLRAAELGHAQAQYYLGLYYESQEDYTNAVFYLRKAAEQGDADAQVELGFCYSQGYGVAQNHIEALKWYHKSAEQGNALAEYNIGCCYAFGLGVEKNYVVAVKYFRKSAEKGEKLAQYNLGCCYENGEGVKRNRKEAIKYYRQAAEQGYKEAQQALRRLGAD